MTWRLALMIGVAVIGCKKAEPPPPAAALPVMSAGEAKRGQDACKAYVERVCACGGTVAAIKPACDLARALPEAIEVSLSVAGNSESTRRDVLQANDSVRKVVKECIEETAKLSGAGCP